MPFSPSEAKKRATDRLRTPTTNHGARAAHRSVTTDNASTGRRPPRLDQISRGRFRGRAINTLAAHSCGSVIASTLSAASKPTMRSDPVNVLTNAGTTTSGS